MPDAHPTKRRHLLAGLGLLALVVVGAAFILRWHGTTPIEQIELRGAEQADRAELLALAQVAPGDTLYEADPLLLADRVRRHPWVREAQIARWPTGTLVIEVEEREPLLVAFEKGAPSYYLARSGHRMPLRDSSFFDVPLVRGLDEPYHPVQPVQHSSLRAFLAALGAAGEETQALLGEVELRGDALWAHTVSGPGNRSVAVQLGTERFGRRLARLAAFWEQAVLTRPEVRIAQIDVRFDGQIITRETSSPLRP